MKYRAVFFDRDNTLTYYNPEKAEWLNRVVSSWSGKPLDLPYEKMMNLFGQAAEGRKPWYRNLEERAELLFRELWCNNDRLLFPETVEVLEYFRGHGFRMGVISDTSPSLEYSLRQLGIAEYFSSFTASSLVGAGKPSPVIFNAALDSLGVTAEESIYVDDYPPEADGARALGFTSFLIDRDGVSGGWTVTSLKELIGFVENAARE